MRNKNKIFLLIFLLPLSLVPSLLSCQLVDKKKIGVIFVFHGGMQTNKPQYMWDATVHQFSYDPNHPVYKLVIWSPELWPLILGSGATDFAVRFLRMYEFEYERIGGTDLFIHIAEKQIADLKTVLDANPYGLSFEVDWAGYMAADQVDHYAYPRFIYYGPDGPDAGANCTYCGAGEEDGPWPGCDPERYNVDGPAERLLKKGVSRIIVVDWTMGGPRFSKTFDVVQMTKRALKGWNNKHGTSIPLLWVNDYSNLMERSYPTAPTRWTRSSGLPTSDSLVPLNGSPNPVVLDPVVSTLHVEGIEAAFSDKVSDADTGVVLFNHALHDNNEAFDPKIDDTLIINKNIKSQLLALHPTINPKNIIGAFGGIQELNPENGLVERKREMRGESYGHAWLYESKKEMPGDEWGYRYWEALEYLKNRGVRHIVIAFPQVVIDNALNKVEVFNQIGGREIGYKHWAKWGTWDYAAYPGVGHPFADYWGIWVDTDCGEWVLNFDGGTSIFTMGATLTGRTSGSAGVIKWFSLNSGSWAEGNAAGSLTLKKISGIFLDNEIIADDKKTPGSAVANGTVIQTSKTECCFAMGGCDDPARPYPPPRQTPLNQKLSDLDPSLCFDISAYGHLGYDPACGAPDPNKPVQNQYTGTWDIYRPPNDDPRVGQLLAKYVLKAAAEPMVYLTNGGRKGIVAGESVTFEAHVTGGGVPAYSYAWSVKKEGDPSWTTVGGNNATWHWNPVRADAGTYAVRCRASDSSLPTGHTGEVVWEDFVVAPI